MSVTIIDGRRAAAVALSDELMTRVAVELTDKWRWCISTSTCAASVAFDEAVAVAGAITPVPGGVQPRTIACLLENMRCAAELIEGRPADEFCNDHTLMY